MSSEFSFRFIQNARYLFNRYSNIFIYDIVGSILYEEYSQIRPVNVRKIRKLLMATGFRWIYYLYRKHVRQL